MSSIIYLYVKQHRNTKLKYFGRTTSKNPYKYPGSGVYWTAHLDKHGRFVDTISLWKFNNQEECTEFALKFSSENSIVESTEWANLVIEDGKQQGRSIKGIKRSVEFCKNLSLKMAGYKHSIETKENASAIAKIRFSVPENNPMFGRTHSQESRKLVSDHRKTLKGLYCWVHNDEIESMILKSDLELYIKQGWTKGRSKTFKSAFQNPENRFQK